MEVYVLDSNFFIEAHRSSYPLDIAHSFWNRVKELAEQGRIISIDKVKNELFDKNDALEEWCRNNLPESFFVSTASVMASYGAVTAWAMSKSAHYLPKALNEFLDSEEADAFLVAFGHADASSRILVTHEVSNPQQKNRIKIPESCIAMGVRYCNTMEMFRSLGVTF